LRFRSADLAWSPCGDLVEDQLALPTYGSVRVRAEDDLAGAAQLGLGHPPQFERGVTRTIPSFRTLNGLR
jgi:hypothetical protein